MKNISKLLIGISLIIISFSLNAQNYYNEWINYGLTYYKFKSPTTGIHRINYNALREAGIDSTKLIGKDIQLIRNGQEVTLFVSSSNLFGASDYIEFYGEKNDGIPDTKLFPKPEDQFHTYYNMFTDTASYFLTLNTSNNNARFEVVPNNISNPPPKEPFYIHHSQNVNLSGYSFGEVPQNLAQYGLNDSQFKEGVGPTGGIGTGVISFAVPLATPNLYTADPNLDAKGIFQFLNDVGLSTDHLLEITIGSKTIQQYSNKYGILRFEMPLNVSDLNTNGTFVRFGFLTQGATDRINIWGIKYPRTFSFENKTRWFFSVSKTNPSYVEIENFNFNSLEPTIYDFKNKQLFKGKIDGNLIKIQFPSSTYPRDSMLIVSNISSEITNVGVLKPLKFTNYIQAGQEGDYIIISNKRLIASTSGDNFLEKFKEYRNSFDGGAYQSQIFYIDELEDQFAWGIKNHSLSIRNFVNYGIDSFSVKPKLLFLVGKGQPYTVKNLTRFNDIMVPTYGDYPSDYLLTARSGADPRPQLGIGRFSCLKGDEIGIYLEKVKEVESIKYDTLVSSMTPANQEWKKRIMHMGGGNTQQQQNTFKNYLNNYKAKIQGPFFGGKVFDFFKTSTDPIQIAQSKYVDSLINGGLSLITFFGHASLDNIDFNLDPNKMQNKGKYFVMITNGCFVGNIFNTYYSLSEQFLLLKDKAAVGYVGPNYFGFANSLNRFSTNVYQSISIDNYGKEIGIVFKEAVSPFMTSTNFLDRTVAQQMNSLFDPALRLGVYARPDYYIDNSLVKIIPEVISTSNDSFEIKIFHKNLGKALDIEYKVLIERIFPDGTFQSFEKRVSAPYNNDSVSFKLETNLLKGQGLNNFRLKIDDANEIDEISEDNNEITFSKFIYGNDIKPIYPYEFCIVPDISNLTLKFSTSDIFSPQQKFVLQIDTTEFFNSPLLKSTNIVANGGLIEWNPNISFIPGKVYYWRGSLDTVFGNPFNWSYSSFLYDPTLSPGWNQSHYFQFLKDKFYTLELPSSRAFKYPQNTRNISITTAGPAVLQDQSILAFFDGLLVARNAFNRRSMMFFVYDTKTSKPLETTQIGTTGFGEYGNVIRTPVAGVQIIEFDTYDPAGRKSAINFINNSIPEDAIVMGYSFYNPFYSLWGADSITTGTNLFQAFENIGVDEIRNIEEGNPFAFFIQKGNPDFENKAQIEVGPLEKIDTVFVFDGKWTKGNLQSTIIGPSNLWKSLDYKWVSSEIPSFDLSKVDVYGINEQGVSTKLLSDIDQGNTNLGISGLDYPYLQLEWKTSDDSSSTPPQLDYWRVISDKIPEAVMNPEIQFTKTGDTVFFGQTFNFSIALQNITDIDMDSMLVRFTIRDGNNNVREILKRFGPLKANQHIIIDFTTDFNTSSNYGLNSILVEANPFDDQIEQYHFNNFAAILVYVKRDDVNPLLDVTFNGKHIIDGEIVSPKPEIVIKLKDENRFLALNDSSAFKLFITFPNNPGNHQEVVIGGTEAKFIPADLTVGNKNEARILYNPILPIDGEYKLEVQGADRSNNDAGIYQYSIKFNVDRRPAISNFLNYPNPFTTSTRFVFTLTGEEVPDDIRIKIMTVTGKVVKEITQDELGQINIGTNITEYAWDGTDQYGDRLANGLYFYKVYSKMNGKKMDNFETKADDFTEKGYGKMYIIR
ncbi:MAG: hypothetical protein IPN09_09610 [Bacteroidetes bacterium]|nr:hypothetical protein [Bacteroidota bacterium]